MDYIRNYITEMSSIQNKSYKIFLGIMYYEIKINAF